MLANRSMNCSLFAQSVQKTTCIVVFSVFFIIGCSEKKTTVQADQLCAMQSEYEIVDTTHVPLASECSFITAFGEIELRSSDPLMTVEQLISMHLRTPLGTYIVASEITGLSMYMGRIPVVWQPIGTNLWQADIYLGACTDPDMFWQLEITIAQQSGFDEVKDEVEDEVEQVNISFQSTWE